MLDVHPQIMEEQAFLAFVDAKKGGAANVLKSFLQGGWKVLEESTLSDPADLRWAPHEERGSCPGQ